MHRILRFKNRSHYYWSIPWCGKSQGLVFVKWSYLLDVALDELRCGHLLGRQTLLQLQLVRRADWLAPLHPGRGTGQRLLAFRSAGTSAKPQDAPKAPESLTYRFRKLLRMYELTVTGAPVTRCYSQPSDLYHKNTPLSASMHCTALRSIVDACCCPVGGGREIQWKTHKWDKDPHERKHTERTNTKL